MFVSESRSEISVVDNVANSDPCAASEPPCTSAVAVATVHETRERPAEQVAALAVAKYTATAELKPLDEVTWDELPLSGDGLSLGFRSSVDSFAAAAQHVLHICSKKQPCAIAVNGDQGYLFGRNGALWAGARFNVSHGVCGLGSVPQRIIRGFQYLNASPFALEVRRTDSPTKHRLRYKTETGASASVETPAIAHADDCQSPFRARAADQKISVEVLLKACQSKTPFVSGTPVPKGVAGALSIMLKGAKTCRVHAVAGAFAFATENYAIGWGPVPSETSVEQSVDGNTVAELWRAKFEGALSVHQAPKALHAELLAGIEARTWTELTDELGNKFENFEDFCSAPSPFGLGTQSEAVLQFLEELFGQRTAALLTVAPPRPGERTDLKTSGPRGPKSRNDKRHRAILRAPKVIQQLYAEKALTGKEAEKFGHRSMPKELIAEVCEQADAARTKHAGEPRLLRQAVKHIVRKCEEPSVRAPTNRVASLFEQFVCLSEDEQSQFLALVQTQRSSATSATNPPFASHGVAS